MARWGRTDYKQLQQLRDNIAKLESVDMEKFCRDVSKELAARLLALVIPATPVGDYPYSSGKIGGTLRRGWTSKTHDEAASSRGDGLSKATAYAQALPISKVGTTYLVEIINPVQYASYVNYGHRTVNGGYVPGQLFLELSERELERKVPSIIERKLERLLRDTFSV